MISILSLSDYLKKSIKRRLSKFFKKRLQKVVYLTDNKSTRFFCFQPIARFISFFCFLINKRFKYLRIVGIDDLDCKKLLKVQRQLYVSKQQFFHENQPIHFIENILTAVALLAKVEIVGGSNAVCVDRSEVLYADHFYDFRENLRITDPSVFIDAIDYLVVFSNKRGGAIREGILLVGNNSNNYYHYTFEIIAKLYLLEELNIDKNIPLILDYCVEITPQFKELLKYVCGCSREFIFIEKGTVHSVQNCYYISPVNIIPQNFRKLSSVKSRDCLFDPRSIDFIRNKCFQFMASDDFPSKIYIARKKATQTRDYNEEEVITLFKENGFEVIYPEMLSIAEQVKLFNSADFIAGASGAAFTNLAYCNNSCKVLIIMAYCIDLSIFSTVAKYVGVDLQYYSTNPSSYIPKDLHVNFKVDINDLKITLDKFLAK
jgi:hypothetical protein